MYSSTFAPSNAGVTGLNGSAFGSNATWSPTYANGTVPAAPSSGTSSAVNGSSIATMPPGGSFSG
ncbi:unnamed protein product, partial [Amoebophrya sp. A25]|eukprot:GSA25T00021887001.1